MSNSVSDEYVLAHDKFCPVYEGSCCPWMGNCVCQCNCDDIAAIRKDERAAALRDAVEAVKALEPLLEVDKYSGGYDCCGCGTLYDLYDDAMTAIEALSTEPVVDPNQTKNGGN